MRYLERIMSAVALLALVAVAAASTGQSLMAVQSGSCVECIDAWYDPVNKIDGHRAQDLNHPYQKHQRREGTHPTTIWLGACKDKHPVGCGGGGGGGGVLYDQARGALEAVLVAVSAGDALEAYRVVLRQPQESLV